MNYSEIAIITSLFSIGLFGGFSHCTAMCGPFVLNQVSNRLNDIDINNANNFKKLSGIALIPYHLGRISSYCLIAFLCNFFATNLKNIANFKIIAAIFLIIAAMLIFNFSITKITLFKANTPFKINLFKFLPSFFKDQIYNHFHNFLGSLFLKPSGFKGFILGVLLGFIPCGLVYGAIMTTMSLNNPLLATIAMFCFGIATIPALLFTAYGGFWFFNKIQKNLKFFIKIILLINIITLLLMAFGLIFNEI